MYGKKPSPSRRRVLLAFLIGGSLAALNLSPVTANDENVLVTTYAQDCCPPADPCAPSVNSYYGSQPAPIPAMPQDGLTAPAPTPSGDLATQPSISEPSATTPQFDAPISQNTANNLPQASAFTGAAASSLASNTGSRGGLDAPNMLGDFPGARTTVSVFGSPYTLPNTGNRRFKITENVSPIPQDRIYFNYNGYGEVLQSTDDDFEALHRYSFGGEKTFADGLFSAEMRMVVTDGFDATQTAARERGTEFGNLQFSLKSLLYQSDSLLVGGGLTLAVPTADDIELVGAGVIENETVYLAPYIGFVATPHRDWFLQGFLQTDFAAGSDSVVAGGAEVGKLTDQNYLYTSLSLGSWLYTDSRRDALVNGVAGLVELHYSTTLNDADQFTAGAAQFTTTRRSDFLNITSGMVFVKGLSSLRVAGGTSLRDGDDDLYDGEITVQINRFF